MLYCHPRTKVFNLDQFFQKKRTGGPKFSLIFNENFGPWTVFAGTKIPVTGHHNFTTAGYAATAYFGTAVSTLP